MLFFFFIFLKVVLLKTINTTLTGNHLSNWSSLTIKRMSFCLGINQLGNNVARIRGVRGAEFWAGAFGNLRNQVEPSSSPWECPTFGQGQVKTATFKQLSLKFYYFVKIFFFSFFCSFPPFDISKSFKHHKTDLAVNGETVPKRNETKNPKDKEKSLNKPSCLVLGVYISQELSTQPPCNVTPWRTVGSTPTTQETANNVFC